MNRRRFLRCALAGGAFPPAIALLSGCDRTADWPEGMVKFVWDRDTCTQCGMVISDHRFAAQILGGPKGEHFKFDDVGCAVTWLNAQAWREDASLRFWAADCTGGDRWLDARKARYIGGRRSPMGYDFGAVAQPQPGSLDFEDMRQHVLARAKG